MPPPADVVGTTPPNQRIYTPAKPKRVIDSAKQRALETDKPDLAAAVYDIWLRSLQDQRLSDLLMAVLAQTASEDQTLEFNKYVRAAKRDVVSTCLLVR